MTDKRNNNLYKKNSRISGEGIFTQNDIEKGAHVATFAGEQVSLFQICFRLIIGDERTLDDPLQIAKDQYLDLDSFSRAFNHSCNPNCGIKNVNQLIALRDIKKDEEITFDYSTTVSPNIFWWKMSCRCGDARCRNTLRSADQLPKYIYDEYRTLGVLPAYVEDKRSLLSLPLFLMITLGPIYFILTLLRTRMK